MRNTLLILTLAVAGCLAFSPEARADVYSWAGVEYDANTNSMRAYIGSQASYEAGVYYCLNSSAYIFKDEIDQGYLYANDIDYWGWPDGCSGYAYAETYLPYDPNAEYSIEAFHEVDVTYEQQVGYYDYYNFIDYTYGDPVYYPNSYGFIGLGPPSTVSLKNILLGTVTSIFSAGAVAGPPHHLKLLSDSYPATSCGSKRRLLQFQVVDSTGRRVGTTQTKETFEDPGNPSNRWSSVYNSCQNTNYSPPACSTDWGGVFTDQLWVGCPSNGGDCGFPTLASRWWWCPRGRPHVSLSTNVYEIRHNSVKVNGNESTYPAGTVFY